jgi:hypothetical protein
MVLDMSWFCNAELQVGSVLTCQYGQAYFGSIPVAYAEDCARAAVLGVLRS